MLLRANKNSKWKQLSGLKRGKSRATKSRVVLVLHLIGWGCGVNFCGPITERIEAKLKRSYISEIILNLFFLWYVNSWSLRQLPLGVGGLTIRRRKDMCVDILYISVVSEHVPFDLPQVLVQQCRPRPLLVEQETQKSHPDCTSNSLSTPRLHNTASLKQNGKPMCSWEGRIFK